MFNLSTSKIRRQALPGQHTLLQGCEHRQLNHEFRFIRDSAAATTSLSLETTQQHRAANTQFTMFSADPASAAPSASNSAATKSSVRTWAMIAAGKEPVFESSSKFQDRHTLIALPASAAIKKPRPAIPNAYYMKRIIEATAAERVRNAAFPKFNELPFEIRAQIWEEACNIRRIIEIIEGRAEFPYRAEVSSISRKIPPILHTNFEARAVGLRVYTAVAFERDNVYTRSPPRLTYFNPTVDVVLFGDKRAAHHMFEAFSHWNFATPQLAVRMNFDLLGAWSAGLILDVLGGYQALGTSLGNKITSTEHRRQIFPGRKELREVTFIVESRLWQLNPGNVPIDALLRPALIHGITVEQVRIIESFRHKLWKVEKETREGTNPWTWVCGEAPAFKFMSLCDPNHNYPVYGAMSAIRKEVVRLQYNDSKVLKELESKHDCQIIIGESEDSWLPSEIGFGGTASAIKAAKAELDRFLKTG